MYLCTYVYAPIIVKFGTVKETEFPLRRAKFHVDRAIFVDFWPNPRILNSCLLYTSDAADE